MDIVTEKNEDFLIIEGLQDSKFVSFKKIWSPNYEKISCNCLPPLYPKSGKLMYYKWQGITYPVCTPCNPPIPWPPHEPSELPDL